MRQRIKKAESLGSFRTTRQAQSAKSRTKPKSPPHKFASAAAPRCLLRPLPASPAVRSPRRRRAEAAKLDATKAKKGTKKLKKKKMQKQTRQCSPRDHDPHGCSYSSSSLIHSTVPSTPAADEPAGPTRPAPAPISEPCAAERGEPTRR